MVRLKCNFNSFHLFTILDTAGSMESQHVAHTFLISKGFSPQFIVWKTVLFASLRFGEIENQLYVSLTRNSTLLGRVILEAELTATCSEWHTQRIRTRCLKPDISPPSEFCAHHYTLLSLQRHHLFQFKASSPSWGHTSQEKLELLWLLI